MNKIITALLLAIFIVSCATPPKPILRHDAKEFLVHPEVVSIEGQRYLCYQYNLGECSIQPVVKYKVIDGDVCCYVYFYISANVYTGNPRKMKMPDEGSIYWLNPDGTRIKLHPKP